MRLTDYKKIGFTLPSHKASVVKKWLASGQRV
jgi:hypothetical protein